MIKRHTKFTLKGLTTLAIQKRLNPLNQFIIKTLALIYIKMNCCNNQNSLKSLAKIWQKKMSLSSTGMFKVSKQPKILHKQKFTWSAHLENR